MSLPDDDERRRKENEERQLRIDQMALNIEKMRSDMRWEARKFTVQIVLGLAAAIGAAIALTNWLSLRDVRHAMNAPSGIAVGSLPTGTVITLPDGRRLVVEDPTPKQP